MAMASAASRPLPGVRSIGGWKAALPQRGGDPLEGRVRDDPLHLGGRHLELGGARRAQVELHPARSGDHVRAASRRRSRRR